MSDSMKILLSKLGGEFMGNRYADYINYRVIETAHYFIEHNSTVRETAKHMGVSKSTTHKDLTERLPSINRLLYEQVNNILEKNKQEMHIRGGIATQEKFKGIKSGQLPHPIEGGACD